MASASAWLYWRELGRGDGATAPLARRLWQAGPAIPLFTAVAVVLFYLAVTGRIATNAAVKFPRPAPVLRAGSLPHLTLNWLPMTLDILLDKCPRSSGMTTRSSWAAGLLGVRGPARRPSAGALVFGWLVLLTRSTAAFVARRDHLDRYYLPYFGLTVVCAWWALSA